MKTTMLVLLIVLAVGTAFAQDTTATPAGNFYADSLKSTSYPATTGNGSPRDTVDVRISSMSGIGYVQITARSTSADTLVISAFSPDGARYVRRAVVNLATGATSTSMITSSTAVDYVVASGPEISKLRFTSPGSTNTIYFVVAGKLGALPGITSPSTTVGDSVLGYFTTPQPVNQIDNGFVVTDSLAINQTTTNTPYSINDFIGSTVLCFRNINAYAAQSITLTNATFKHDTVATSTGVVSFLALNDSVSMSTFTDNAAFALPLKDSVWKANFVETFIVTLNEAYGLTGAASYSQGSNTMAPFVCKPVGRNLYLVAIAKAAFASKWKGHLYVTLRGFRN